MTLQIQFSGNINKRRKRFEDKRSAALFAGMSVCRLLIWVLAAWILIKAGKSAYSFGYQVFAQRPVSSPPGKNVSVTVSEGMTGAELGESFEEIGNLSGMPRSSRCRWSCQNIKNQIHPGTYILNSSQTADEMLAVLAVRMLRRRARSNDK